MNEPAPSSTSQETTTQRVHPEVAASPHDPSQPFGRSAVVALTMAPTDANLLEHAAEVTRALQISRVYLAHVAPTFDLPAHLRKTIHKPTDEELQEELDSARKQHGAWAEGIEFHPEVREGSPVGGVLKLVRQKEVDLVCLGHRGPDGQQLLSNHARKIFRGSPCSVLAIPSQKPAKYRKLLVPTDFSAHAELALKAALTLAHQLPNCQVVAQHVYDVPPRWDLAGCTFEEFAESLEQHARERWEVVCERMPAARTAEVRFDLIPHDDRTHEVSHLITRVADEIDADLIVCGSQGLTALASLVVGSVVEGLMQHSRRPILCVKRKGETHGLLDVLFSG